jgi:NADPH:quinone reductase-like Zn-dependent oxidoreductase
MKAVRFHSPGGPDVLVEEEVPVPELRPGEVLVKVAACGVNRIDIWLRNGRYECELPHVLGADISGEVDSLGPGVTNVEVGKSVVVYPALSDGTCRFCLEGFPNRCVNGGLVGRSCDGGYAEYVRVPAVNVLDAGDLDLRVAAALPVNFGTAWNAFVERATVRPDDSVLVWGAAGGLGHAAVQVAKMLGARVIGVAGGEEKRKFVVENGADHFIDHTTEDVVARAKEITGGFGVDVVFDDVGGDTWEKSLSSLAKGGTVLSVALTSGGASSVDVGRLYRNELAIVGVVSLRKETLTRVLQLASAGSIKPRIFREFPLGSAREAHEVLESRQVEGKILLIP